MIAAVTAQQQAFQHALHREAEVVVRVWQSAVPLEAHRIVEVPRGSAGIAA